MEAQNWKSPRKVQEDIRDYQRKRFEDYMRMADEGTLSRELAIAALRDEVEMEFDLTAPQDDI